MEAAPVMVQINQEKTSNRGMMEIEGPRNVGQQRNRHGDDGNIPGQLLSAGEIARHLQEGDSGHQHQRTAVLNDADREPFGQSLYHCVRTRPNRGKNVDDPHEADQKRRQSMDVDDL